MISSGPSTWVAASRCGGVRSSSRAWVSIEGTRSNYSEQHRLRKGTTVQTTSVTMLTLNGKGIMAKRATRRFIALLAFSLLLAATVTIPSAVVRHHREQSKRTNLFTRWAATSPAAPKVASFSWGGKTIARPVAFGRDTLFVVEPYTPAAQLVITTPRAPNIAAGMAGVAPTAPAIPGPPPPAVPMPAE